MPDRLAEPALPRLYSGSVKEVFGIEGKSPYIFEFSNRYSIFDWGEMPDSLEGKGEALAVMGDLFFRHLARADVWAAWQISVAYPKFWRDSLTTSGPYLKLRREGLNHHSLGLVDETMRPLAPGKKSNRLAVQALTRPAALSSAEGGRVKFDYSAYQSRPENCLVPLEVVFRFGAPEGSSFLERLETIPGYSESFGFTEKPAAGEWFPYPVVEFFTKMEPTDRYLTREEARVVGGLSSSELDDLSALTLLLALRLKDVFSPLGLELWDGKFEFAFLPGEKNRVFQLVDSIGPDELRLIGSGGVHFSKEFLRRVYRHSPWFDAIATAKRLAKERGVKEWKKICRDELGMSPASLPREALTAATALYPALAEALAQNFFGFSVYPGQASVPELCRLMREVR
jgi:phosphoribosylaminoimidazole-succinocarboxamide synthase